MPVITERELETYKAGLSEVEKLRAESSIQDMDNERELSKVTEKVEKYKKIAIALGILALLGILYSSYTYAKNSENQNMLTAYQDYEARTANETSKTEIPDSLDSREVFAVQIGAFEKRDLSLYSENFVNFREIRNGQLNKFTLGNFETLDEAKLFREELISLGFTDAFIGVYMNGERIRIEEVF